MEFSCRLRYRVLTEMLCGTSSSPFLVQITRLAWLEQLQRLGQGGVASTSWGPLIYGHKKSWTNQRRGKGLQRPVNMAAHMANESCPTPSSKKIWFTSTGMAGGVDSLLNIHYNEMWTDKDWLDLRALWALTLLRIPLQREMKQRKRGSEKGGESERLAMVIIVNTCIRIRFHLAKHFENQILQMLLRTDFILYSINIFS